MKWLIHIGVYILLCVQSASGLANNIVDADEAMRHQDYDRALRIYRTLADEKNPEAMLGLGRIYLNGLGVEPDAEKGKQWVLKAANIWGPQARAGDPYAYASLGVLFQKGIGFPKDRKRANTYFISAYNLARPRADEGEARAEHLIGMLLSSGKGVDKDVYAGANWLSRAGEKGHQASIRILIYIFDCGCRGLPKDDDKAGYWRSKLAGAASGKTG